MAERYPSRRLVPYCLSRKFGGVGDVAFFSISHEQTQLNWVWYICSLYYFLTSTGFRFQNLLQETVGSTLYRSGVVQACLNELPNHCFKPGWTAKRYNFPKPIATDCVKSFATVDKGHVEVHILFLIFLLEMPGWKEHWSSCFPQTTPVDLLVEFQPGQDSHAGESVGFGQYLPGSRQYNKEIPLWLSQTWAFPFRM